MSKHERKMTRKERRELERKNGPVPRGSRNGIAIWSIAALAVVIGVVGIIYVAKQKPAEVVKPLANKISDSDWVYGNRDAKTVLVEYSDFQCPACGAYYPVVKKIKDTFSHDIAFVYRHFPIPQLHKNAKAAAYAGEAAGRQGKFWEMHDMIFEHQKEWSELDHPEETFAAYAATLHLNVEKFKADEAADDIRSKVEHDAQSGVASGVDSTPSFFLNEKKIENPNTYEDFQKLIERTIAR